MIAFDKHLASTENNPVTWRVLICRFSSRLFLYNYAGKVDFSGCIRICLSREKLFTTMNGIYKAVSRCGRTLRTQQWIPRLYPTSSGKELTLL